MEKVEEEMLCEYKDALYYYDKEYDGTIPTMTEINDMVQSGYYNMKLIMRRKEGDMEE